MKIENKHKKEKQTENKEKQPVTDAKKETQTENKEKQPVTDAKKETQTETNNTNNTKRKRNRNPRNYVVVKEVVTKDGNGNDVVSFQLQQLITARNLKKLRRILKSQRDQGYKVIPASAIKPL